LTRAISPGRPFAVASTIISGSATSETRGSRARALNNLDDYFRANAIGSAVLNTSSSAQPAMFQTPPPAM
jgi:hypothetical protein